MTDILKPRDTADMAQALAWAAAEGTTVEIVGHGSKRMIGRAAQTDLTLDVSGISGVTLYEPEELILSAKAGTPVAEIEKLLAEHDQELAFEPMDCGPILGASSGRGTLGGTVAANLSGPRRIKAGAARDFVLGVDAVSGRGERFKSGGRVVKNVTGYDLSKLLTGSWGTLAVISELTIKVLPRAGDMTTVLILNLDDARAVEAMSAALGSACEVSGAAHLPAPVAAGISVAAVSGAGRAITAFRLEGIPASVAYRRDKLLEVLRPFGTHGLISAEDSRELWRALRDALPFADGSRNALWRISAAPREGAKIAHAIAASAKAEVFYDWGGGLIWAAMPNLSARANVVRAALAGRGHALLMRGDPAERAGAVFEPQAPALAALTKRVKESFDPKRILGPGRMYAGV
jgi:glycolate oxidase FAD binding subunit